LASRDYREPPIQPKANCPLCGSRIVRALSYSMARNDRALYSYGAAPLGFTRGQVEAEVEWQCAGGCMIRVTGPYEPEPAVPADIPEVAVSTDAPEAPINGSDELKAKARRAKAALEELDDE